MLCKLHFYWNICLVISVNRIINIEFGFVLLFFFSFARLMYASFCFIGLTEKFTGWLSFNGLLDVLIWFCIMTGEKKLYFEHVVRHLLVFSHSVRNILLVTATRHLIFIYAYHTNKFEYFRFLVYICLLLLSLILYFAIGVRDQVYLLTWGSVSLIFLRFTWLKSWVLCNKI